MSVVFHLSDISRLRRARAERHRDAEFRCAMRLTFAGLKYIEDWSKGPSEVYRDDQGRTFIKLGPANYREV